MSRHSQWQISVRERSDDDWDEWRYCDQPEYEAALDVIREDGKKRSYYTNFANAPWHVTVGRIARVRHQVPDAEPI